MGNDYRVCQDSSNFVEATIMRFPCEAPCIAGYHEQQPVRRKERARSERVHIGPFSGWGRMHNSYLGGPEKGERKGKEPLIGGVHICKPGTI